MTQSSKQSLKLQEILSKIERSPALRVLLKRLTLADSGLSQLLLAGDEVLFPTVETPEAPEGMGLRLPMLMWTSVALKPSPEAQIERLADTVQLAQEAGETQRLRWEGIAKSLMAAETLRDLITYYVLKFARATPETRALVRAKDFSFVTMKKTLANFGDIDLDSLFSEMTYASGQAAVIAADVDQGVVRILQSVPKAMVRAIQENAATILEGQFLGLDMLLNQHVSRSAKYVDDVCSTCRIDATAFRQSLHQLYSLHLIDTLDCVFWCDNVEHDPFMMRTKSAVDALESGPTCPKCGRSTEVSIAFRLDQTLLDSLYFQAGGILMVMVGWQLRQKDIQFETCVYQGDQELDFLTHKGTQSWIFECKMHRKNVDPAAAAQMCLADIGKVEKKIKAFGENEPSKALLIYNWPQEVIRGVIESDMTLARKLQKSPVQLIGYSLLPDILA